MLNHKIKADYSSDIEQFLQNGGEIKSAENTNKAEFNYFDADTVAKNTEKPNSHQNHVLRTRAEKHGLKSYTLVASCKSCQTSERSVRSNVCLECDRRRFRLKTGLNESKLVQAGEYLLSKNTEFLFTSGGKKYILKVEMA